MTRLLRWCRARTSAAIAAAVAAVPALEPAYIRIGRGIAGRFPLLGTVYWFSQDDLIRRLRVSNRRFRPLRIAGVAMAVDVTDATGRLDHFYGQPYEPGLANAVVKSLSPGDVFLDVGANIGFFSVLAATCVGPKGKVIAFEPHPAARDVLKQAVAANGVSTIVEVIDAAAGAASGTVPLFLSEDSVLSTVDPSRAPSREHFAFSDSIDVPLVALDSWLGQRPDLRGRLRAIKIDVEGTEADVLHGMAETLSTSPPARIFCETEPDGPADVLLRSYGYRASPLDQRPETVGNYEYALAATSGP